MNALRGWRRLAVKLVRYAALALPAAAASPWADAMRRELDYIEDDRTALRWAFGCVLASYKARLVARSGSRTREVLRQVVASGALMLVIGLVFLENAGGQTEPPRPIRDEPACETPNTMSDMGRTPPSGIAGVIRDAGRPTRQPDASCTEPPAATRAPQKFEPSRGVNR
jgi:hypothetical protein